MKQEKMENEENKNTEQRESFSELDDSNLSVGGEKVDEVVVEEGEEKQPVVAERGEDGEESVREKYDVVGSELEMDALTELDMDSGETNVIERVGSPVLTAEEAAAEETQVLESEVGGMKGGCDSGDSLLGLKGDDELVSVVAGDGSKVSSGTWDFGPHAQSEMDVIRAAPLEKEGMEVRGPEAGTEMEEERGKGQQIEKEEGAELEVERTQILEVDSATVVEAGIVSEEKVTDKVIDSEVGITEKLLGTVEEKSNSKTQIEVVNCNEGEQVPNSDGRTINFSTDMEGKSATDRVIVEESLMAGNITEEKDMSLEVLKGLELSELSNAVEIKEVEAVSLEEISAVDTKTETEECMEIKVTRDDTVQEIQVADSQMETEMVERNDMFETIPSEDTKRETGETKSDVDEPGLELNDQLAAIKSEDDEAMVVEDTETQDTEMETETDVAESVKSSREKQKRVRNSKSPSSCKATAKASARKKVGEDVCFICFDGGDLVLCDRRGCPKAYHPSCVNRDEAFFSSKGRWNCGWHMCSICEKNAHYMCYTCTYSSCRSCIKDAVIFCVRGNKGFCETCMRTVMLIENNRQENQAQLDFDDKSSWEYLFKDYYIGLKSKLSLSSAEVAVAKHPWKGSKQESPEAQIDADYDGGSGSDDSTESQKTSKSKRRKLKKRSKTLTKEDESVSVGLSAGNENISSSVDTEWATKELLEFVSHMRNGDVSPLSQFDVQALLLEYIKRNKLRDPRRKSQIICDSRLGNLFGKPRVGHFEMLKLLESHFPTKKDKTDEAQGSLVGTEINQLEVDADADTLARGVKGKKSKTRKKGDRRGPQSNLEDYAAIDTHNITLIYLRRKLMEDLLEDVDKFHDKVVGAFVRIRISGSSQKQDLYRLVQVVGTSKAAEPYKIGKKNCDTMLEILNLDKAEVISIDTISNQEFSEEECKRLRQSIKCGLINRLTVGDILDKTMEIQAARVNDWLESEVMRLNHLRDRASDLGRRKELRECVEKLQLLKTPDERRRRLEEIPEIHADPKMDPSYESDEDDNETDNIKRDSLMRSGSSSFNRRGRGLISPGSDYDAKDTWNGLENFSSKNLESRRNLSSKSMYTNASHSGEIVIENSWNQDRDKDVQESKSVEWTMNSLSQSQSLSVASPVTSMVSLSDSVAETAVSINETEKVWHYKDPSGKVRGPFSMTQLHKWNNTGYFPADLRIWRTTLEQEPILLTDALAGKYQKDLPAVDNRFPTINIMHSPVISSSHPGKISGTSLHQDMQRPNTNQDPRAHPKNSTENWIGNDSTNLPSPTPKQKNAGWMGEDEDLFHGAAQYPSGTGLLHSPSPALPNTVAYSSPTASVLNSVVQSGTAFSPMSNSEKGVLAGSVDSLQIQSNMSSEPHSVQMHGHLPTIVQSVHTAISLNPHVETSGWGSSPQSGRGKAQVWGGNTLDVQNSAGNFSNSDIAAISQPDLWRPPTQGILPNMLPPSTQNVSWGTRPEYANTGWGNVQANPNTGWGTPTPGSANINVGPAVQAPTLGNTSGWVGPSGNPGTTVQGPVFGNVNSGWVATPGWGSAPVQGPVPIPVPGNGWGPPSGNSGTPVQGLAQANPNQGFGAPAGSQGVWGGGQNHNGGQFSSQMEMRDPGFGGGRTSWNRPSSFGSGGSRPFNKRGKVCPYNANGRCRKGARCDYIHT
ncbi:zinc finger CCCH domain-containing protein 19 isoform X1 [Olea europaea var. sylvestris]|uniref:zinc finger CCCH domain-containing protein 19 isoform X1 n=1 Tax=Olea europaea var. sylvestris TaxID=158386 RepID=UPI000C1D0F7D|nr:zinc finger CCCH domain-containing protein 19 isoform X1 [Olea europaea var. sylvestris]